MTDKLLIWTNLIIGTISLGFGIKLFFLNPLAALPHGLGTLVLLANVTQLRSKLRQKELN